MKVKQSLFLALIASTTLLTSCNFMSDKVLKPGTLYKGGTEIDIDEFDSRITKALKTKEDIENLNGFFNIKKYYIEDNSEYDGNQMYKKVNSTLSVNGNIDFAFNSINDDENITACINFNDLNYSEYTVEDLHNKMSNAKGQKTSENEYKNVNVSMYFSDKKLYLNMQNGYSVSFVEDFLGIKNIHYYRSYVSNVKLTFNMKELINYNSLTYYKLKDYKEMFNNSIKFVGYGEKGFGLSFSITQDKMFNDIINHTLLENGLSKDDLTSEQLNNLKDMMNELKELYQINKLKASLYFDIEKGRLEESIDIDYKLQSEEIKSDSYEKYSEKMIYNMSSCIKFEPGKIQFPSDLAEYHKIMYY